MGSLCGMAVASLVVLPNLQSDLRDSEGNILFATLSEAEKSNIRLHDLALIRNPYVILGVVVLLMLIIISLFVKTKDQQPYPTAEPTQKSSISETLSRLWRNQVYREGVFTQAFYVAAQIMTWTFIIQYADNLGINKATAQNYNIIDMFH